MFGWLKRIFASPRCRHQWEFIGIDSYLLSNDYRCRLCGEECWFYQEATPPSLKAVKEASR